MKKEESKVKYTAKIRYHGQVHVEVHRNLTQIFLHPIGAIDMYEEIYAIPHGPNLEHKGYKVREISVEIQE
jgi:hypothetical protein